MRIIGIIVANCLALALAGAVAQVAGLIIMALIILGFIINPRETFGVIFGLILLGLMAKYPLVGLPLLLAMMIFAIRQQGRE